MSVQTDGNDVVVSGGSAQIGFSGEGLVPAPEVGIAALLYEAMASSEQLHLEDPVPQGFLSGVNTIQDVMSQWIDRLTKVPVFAPIATDSAPRTRRTAAFFSGGVDSFYTLHKLQDQIDALVFVIGFDLTGQHPQVEEEALRNVQATAEELGKEFVTVRTDLRALSDRTLTWPMYHGAGLAAVAYTVTHRFDRFIIPASYPYRDLVPWGTHPLLDPHWGGGVEFIHDGCEASRFDKVRAIATDETARERLRVCTKNTGGTYNCGRCEKCIRTMVALRAVGCLDGVSAFTVPLSLDEVRAMPIRTSNAMRFALDNLQSVERDGNDAALAGALRRQIQLARVRNLQINVKSSAVRFAVKVMPETGKQALMRRVQR